MRTSRLEAFSDGVLAIIITIMVLELKVPHEPTLEALGGSVTGFLTYLLSFVYGVNLLLAALAYYVLEQVIFHAEGGAGLRQLLAGHDPLHHRGHHLARARPTRGAVPRDATVS